MFNRIKYLSLVIVFFLTKSCKKEKDQTIRTHLNPKLSYNQLVDIEGNVYSTIKIGGQEWMAENLRTTHYSNGDSLPELREDWKWYNADSGAFCYYQNDQFIDSLYGKHYNWYAATDSRNICPIGWRVPNLGDWNELVEYIGGSYKAGYMMKTQKDGYWAGSEYGASNESGFSALPSGRRGIMDTEGGLNYVAKYWMTDQHPIYHKWAYSFEIYWNGHNTFLNFMDEKDFGYCVRCIKN